MKLIRMNLKLLALASACMAVGVGVGAIASAGAATSPAKGAATPAKASAKAARAGGLRRYLRRAVHGELSIPTKAGLATVTFDRGVVRSVSGQVLTLVEGAKTAAPKTVTVTIATTAKVRDNGKRATLTQLTAGQRVTVLQGPKQTWVVARTPRTR